MPAAVFTSGVGCSASASHAAGVQAQSTAAAAPLDARLIDAREKQRQAERLSQMCGGTVLTKYQRGEGGLGARLFAPRQAQEKRRKERVLRLSEDLRELRWAKTGGSASKLKLVEVTGLVHGHETDLFREMLIVPDAPELCFSLVSAKREYCFAARTTSQAETWVVGLSALLGLPMARRGAFLWNELRLRTQADSESTGIGALLPRLARELDERRRSNVGESVVREVDALTRSAPSERSESRDHD